MKRLIAVTFSDGSRFAFDVEDIIVVRQHKEGTEITRSSADNLIVTESIDQIVEMVNKTIPLIVEVTHK